MIEFKPGNIAHVSNGTRVCGMSNPDAPTEGRAGIHRFLLRYGDACIIVKVHPSRNAYAKKHTGGATYDVTHERDGVLYHIEHLEQRVFCSKKGWETDQRIRADLDRLKKQLLEEEHHG